MIGPQIYISQTQSVLFGKCDRTDESHTHSLLPMFPFFVSKACDENWACLVLHILYNLPSTEQKRSMERSCWDGGKRNSVLEMNLINVDNVDQIDGQSFEHIWTCKAMLIVSVPVVMYRYHVYRMAWGVGWSHKCTGRCDREITLFHSGGTWCCGHQILGWYHEISWIWAENSAKNRGITSTLKRRHIPRPSYFARHKGAKSKAKEKSGCIDELTVS